jgi:hypothetical protein
MNRRPTLAWLGATAALALARAVEMRLNTRVGDATIDWGSRAFILGLIAGAAIHAGIVVWLASRSRLRDPARVYALIAIGLGVVIVNNVEAAVFGIAPARSLAVVGLLAAGVHAAVVLGVARLVPVRQDITPAPAALARSASRTTLTFILLGLLYAVVYFTAGGVIYAFVREFYADKPLPGAGPLFALQALVRGPLFVAIGMCVVQLTGRNRPMSILATACTLSGLGGLTALLVPNPLFPDGVRLVHLAEVGISNAVFGVVVGWVLSRHRPAARPDG